MKLTVIICTYNRPHCVERLLESMNNQTRQPDQLIIVDSGDDGKVESLGERYANTLKSDVEYCHCEKGLTLQRNIGIDKATGDIVGFFDDDVVLDNGYFDEIIKPFSDEKVGAVSGYVYENDFDIIESFILRNYMKSAFFLWGEKFLSKVYNMATAPRKVFVGNIATRCLSGCNMFFRRSVFGKHKFAQWFEEYSNGEDMEMGLRVSLDWKIVATESARLHHYHESSGRVNYKKLGKMSVYNFVRILTVARDDKILVNAVLLTIRRMLGVFLTSLFFVLRGRFKDGLEYVWGGIIGAREATKYIIDFQTAKR